MNFRDAEALANAYIEQYLPGWKFAWMGRAVRTLGQCSYREKEIRLASSFVSLNNESEVEKTIIHEIAHALCPKHHHDWVWKMKCKELGGDGKTTCSTNVRPPSKLIGECPNGHKYYAEKRKNSSCGRCSNKFNPEFMIVWRTNPDYVRG